VGRPGQAPADRINAVVTAYEHDLDNLLKSARYKRRSQLVDELRDRVDSRTTFELNLAREFSLTESGSSYITANLSAGIVRNASTNYARARVVLPPNDFSETYFELGLAWTPF